MKKLSFALSILLVVWLVACTGQTTTPSSPSVTATEIPEPTPSPTAVPILASLPDGDLVYGDPDGRFSFPLPLAGGWIEAESDRPFSQIRLADPDIDLFVVTAETESDHLKDGIEAALLKIGVDISELELAGSEFFAPWLIHLYTFEDGRAIGAVARMVDGETVAIVPTGELGVISSLRVPIMTTLEGFANVPLTDYLEFQPPPIPTTVDDIEDLSAIDFYNGRTKLVGRLTLPEGEGPFPTIVFTGWGSGKTKREQFSPYFMTRAGFAVFSYDKRGAGDSEGTFVPVGLERPIGVYPTWRMMRCQQ